MFFPNLTTIEFKTSDDKPLYIKLTRDPETGAITAEKNPDGEGLRPAPAAELEEPYVIRPTSETIIGDSMSKWIQSYRDLPLKLNQWCNVMRWEMRPRLFLRTSEFLWQEGHNAFETEDGAREYTHKMLEVYATFAEESLAIPVIKGEKTADERFPGADMTLTIEAMMQDGKALQAGTSHYLGQNFAKSCGIKFLGREGAEQFAYTTSWGISTRLVGAMIMTHGDDDGMIMPPRIAPHQVGIIPIIRDDADTDKIMNYAQGLVDKLEERGIRVHLDASENRTGDKMWGMIKQGVPIRVEIGGREVDDGTLTHVRRDLGRDSKASCSVDEFAESAQGILDAIHDELFNRAKTLRDENIHDVTDLAALDEFFKAERIGFARIDSALIEDAEYERICKSYSLTSRCLPFSDDGTKVLVGKAY